MILNIITVLAFLALAGFKLKNGFHMLQQEMYLNNEYYHWYKGKKKVLFSDIFAPCAGILAGFINIYAGKITYILITLLTLALLIKIAPKAKKAFVITARVKRLITTSVILGIISAAAIMCLLNTTFFITMVLVIALNISMGYLVAVVNKINSPVESLINRWYINDAKRIINELPSLKVVGITGSYGKTSTKYILTKLLSEKYHTLMTPESYNTTMGVVKTVRNSLTAAHEIFVCEMGAKYVGDIKEICDIVRPSYGIITSIGPQHLETFLNIENIIKTKYELYDAVENKENVVVNVSSPVIRANMREGVTPCGIDMEDGGRYYAKDVSYGTFGVRFVMCCEDGTEISLETKLLGRHTVSNIIAAAAMALKLGVEPEQIRYALRRLEPVPHRLQMKNHGNGITVIDDAFNSNAEGSKAAVDVLGKFEKGKRMLITPGMIELGDKEYEINFEFGRCAAKNCDYIILVGEKQTIPIKDGIKSAGYGGELYVAADLGAALIKMNNVASDGWTVLFENDLPDLYL